MTRFEKEIRSVVDKQSSSNSPLGEPVALEAALTTLQLLYEWPDDNERAQVMQCFADIRAEVTRLRSAVHAEPEAEDDLAHDAKVQAVHQRLCERANAVQSHIVALEEAAEEIVDLHDQLRSAVPPVQEPESTLDKLIEQFEQWEQDDYPAVVTEALTQKLGDYLKRSRQSILRSAVPAKEAVDELRKQIQALADEWLRAGEHWKLEPAGRAVLRHGQVLRDTLKSTLRSAVPSEPLKEKP